MLALTAFRNVTIKAQPSGRPVAESPQDTVFDELAAVVDQALVAKSVEEDRLAQHGVEKQRLVSRLMPNGDCADGHPLAIEGYVSERDPESAKNLSVVLKLEEHSLQRRGQLEDAIALGETWLEAKRLYGLSGAESHNEEQGVELFVVVERLKDLVAAPPTEPPLREIDGARLNREFARLDKRERELAEVQSELERQQQLSATVVVLWNELSQSRDGNAKLRDQLARVQQQNQRLQDEHRQSMLSVQTLERELVALKADLVQVREAAVRLTRESQAPVSPARESKVAHVDQTPRPMAPYGYWASPSGYRYGGRW
jgi:hypothetical protein